MFSRVFNKIFKDIFNEIGKSFSNESNSVKIEVSCSIELIKEIKKISSISSHFVDSKKKLLLSLVKMGLI